MSGRLSMLKSYSYEAFTWQGDVYCSECLPAEAVDSDEEPYPIFADSEWDYVPCCCVCGEVHDYVRLTNEGQEHYSRVIEEE